MKKTMWVAIGAVLVLSVAAAIAQEVLAVNSIGYIKRELPPGGDLILRKLTGSISRSRSACSQPTSKRSRWATGAWTA